MKMDVNRLGLSVAAAFALCFVVGYLALAGVLDWKFHPMLHWLHLNGHTMKNIAFAGGEFLGGLVVFSAWGYLSGAVVAWAYDYLDK